MIKRNIGIAAVVVACLGSMIVALAEQKETEKAPAAVTPTAQDLAPVTKLEKPDAERN
jgi:hypothetical protein